MQIAQYCSSTLLTQLNFACELEVDFDMCASIVRYDKVGYL